MRNWWKLQLFLTVRRKHCVLRVSISSIRTVLINDTVAKSHRAVFVFMPSRL